jgi:uncharacterized protein YoxC
MSATDLAAIIVAIASVVGVVLLGAALWSITATLRTVRDTVEVLRTETIPVMNELGQTVQAANADLERVETLLGTAESISTTVDSASRLAYLAFSNPVIKTMAFAAGTSRAARRLRRPAEDD